MIRVFEFLGDMLPSTDYNVSYQDIDESLEKSIGIYILDGGDSVKTLDGEVVYNVFNIHYQVQSMKLSTNGANAVAEGYRICNEIVRCLEEIKPNTRFDRLMFISAEQIGQILMIGKNKYDLPIFSINYKLKYI